MNEKPPSASTLYTKAEADRLTEGYAAESRLIDAGWMARVASTAPGDVTKGELHVSRSAFFAGTKYMLDMFRVLMAEKAPPKTAFALFRDLDVEIKAFLAEEVDGPPPPGPPPGPPH